MPNQTRQEVIRTLADVTGANPTQLHRMRTSELHAGLAEFGRMKDLQQSVATIPRPATPKIEIVDQVLPIGALQDNRVSNDAKGVDPTPPQSIDCFLTAGGVPTAATLFGYLV